MDAKIFPLGKILHIIGREAICRPSEAFIAKGARVVTVNQKRVGTLGDPFGPVDHPYQPIILDKVVGDEIMGQLTVAQYKGRKRNKARNS